MLHLVGCFSKLEFWMKFNFVILHALCSLSFYMLSSTCYKSSVSWNYIVGTYNCTVENIRGESLETVVVPGET